MDGFGELYGGNTAIDYVIAFLLLAALETAAFFAHKKGLKKLQDFAKKTDGEWDDYIITLVSHALVPIMYFGAFWLSMQYLTLSDKIGKALGTAAVAVLTFVVTRVVTDIIGYGFELYKQRTGMSDAMAKSFKGILGFLNGLVWVLAAVFFFDNIGVKITAVLAGLGVGGIAVALAAQTVLSDVFSYVSILVDRPFEVGDTISIDALRGSVEHIGIKTTRLKSVTGEQLIIANSQLTSARLQNFKRMEERRVLFTVGVTYQTTADKLKKIPALVKAIVDGYSTVKFDHCFLNNFGASSLDFQVVYFVQTGDFAEHAKHQHEIFIKIIEAFAKEKIDFAYPTQTLYVQKTA
jgi:small-conductance mechanosensitive channel